MAKYWHSKEWLYDHIWVKNLTLSEIGRKVGVSKTAIRLQCKKFNVKRRTVQEAQINKSKHYKQPWATKENLKSLYNTLSLTQIAEKYKISYSVILTMFKNFDIERRTNAESAILKNQHKNGGAMPFSEWSNYDFLYKLYIKQQKSILEISKICGWSRTCVQGRLETYNIIRRDLSEAGKCSISIKTRWENEEYRQKMAFALSNRCKVSKLQTILYSILDDLDVKYYREYNNKENDKETIIGNYTLDCVIPLLNNTLLIECNGNYFHSSTKTKIKDRNKWRYFYEKDGYELKYLWEHEYYQKDRLVERIKNWIGYTFSIENFNFSDIVIKQIKHNDYKDLLLSYHYIYGSGRGGIAYGAYLNDKLIAVCIFSSPVRQNIAHTIKPLNTLTHHDTRELSRFCIHPKYQKKNFGSWFISRCLKLLRIKRLQTKVVFAYCDTTFNHDGAMYKACNFKLDKIVRPDYWYVDKDNFYIHKKSLYDNAKKMSMTEAEFAREYGFNKIYGREKLRFVYGLNQKYNEVTL